MKFLIILFSAFAISLSAQPQLIAPANGSTPTTITPTMQWQYNGPAMYYRLTISISPNGEPIVYSQSTASSSHIIPSGYLYFGQQYFWRVSAYNGKGYINSSTFTFTPTPISNILNGSSSTNEKFELYNNYPNPFNPRTTINYKLPIAGFAQLNVYDALGNEVENLVNEKQIAGSYSVDFNAATLPSGIYFYKLITESFSDTKKMVLVK